MKKNNVSWKELALIFSLLTIGILILSVAFLHNVWTVALLVSGFLLGICLGGIHLEEKM